MAPQLRLLAPKGKSHPQTPVQDRLQLGHSIFQDEQPTEGNGTGNEVNLQRSATSQSCVPSRFISVSSGHDVVSSPLLPPDSTVSNLERKQYAAVSPCTNTYSSSIPITAVGTGFFPEVSPRNLLSVIVTPERHGLSTHYPPYGNLQLRDITQNRQSQDYLIPTLHAPEDAVWASMTQPTIGFHQDQSTVNQQPPISTQQLPPSEPAYHTQFVQNLQHVSCVNCPSIWCLHLESIMFSDPEDKGISNLKHSYRDLRRHVHETHHWHYGASCALCENLFCYHLDKMMLLEAAKGDLCEAKTDLRKSFKALRDHIQEAHGGC
ncbi:hypothetical protein L211DRAFT_842359 [Terfezia boudieri ATCC MYA-4762]|uniref:Uncharacterized protein n=1 Tax=Terfezia boudieri ATCC MYA-4762 TaxID=1051890 RepID=A0A3N4LP63_9PEZI|nr:hypothetical protein L211DRAFT_842359 [Terfezia boudieri ATCC MYA-4762]